MKAKEVLPIGEIELESAVLGAVLLEQDKIFQIEADLKPELFLDANNVIICRAILECRKNNIPIDLRTVAVEVKKARQLETIGGTYTIAKLTDKISSASNIEYHVKILQQWHLLREINRISRETMVRCNEPKTDPFELMDVIRNRIESLEKDNVSSKPFITMANKGMEIIMELEERRAGNILPGMKVGLKKFDEHFGFHKTDFVIVAARPGMGKTAFLIKAARDTAIKKNKPAAIFSLEMSAAQLLVRLISAECEIDSELIKNGNLTHQQMNDIHKKVKELENCKLYIDDTPNLDIDRLCQIARKMKRELDIEEIFIDYIGLISTSEFPNQRNNQIGHISRKIKQLAKELDIPIIALAQLSRNTEGRSDDKKMPMLSDLRDSGDIEQDADQVYFLFRPQYYGMKTFNVNGAEIDILGKCFIICAKNRHGKLMTELFRFIGKFTDFKDDYSTTLNETNAQQDLF